jgi:N-acetyl-anhydromuramyl-L-alanine amidase AmpD
MQITWIGSPNFGYPDGTQGRNGYTPVAVVLHIAEGTLAGCDSWFNSPANPGSSTHYCIGKQGEIHQYVDESDAAWGNGQVKKPTWPLLITGVNPNLYTLSIEHEGHTGEAWTEPMFQADVWLIKQMLQRWEIPVDRDHIIGHYQIDSVNRPNCPGTGLPWDRLLAELSKPGPIEDQVKKLQQQVADLQAKLDSIGRLVRAEGDAQVYLLKDDTLYPIANIQTLELLYSPSLVEVVPAAEIAGLAQGVEIDVV